MFFRKKLLSIFVMLVLLLVVSCSSRTTLSKAEIAYQKDQYKQVLKLTPILELDAFKEWGLKQYLLGSNARTPLKNEAQLADEKRELAAQNKKIDLVLRAMLATDNQNFQKYLVAWYTCYPISQYHVDFASRSLKSSGSKLVILSANINTIIDFRVYCYKRDWNNAYLKLTTDFNDTDTNAFFENKDLPFLVDIFKAITYGSNNNRENAVKLSQAAYLFSTNSKKNFLCHFFSGKLYDKENPQYRPQALQKFKDAMNASETPFLYDYALWYYLTTTKKNSTRSALNATLEFASSWHDTWYFDDFLDELGESMLFAKSWDTYYLTYKFLMPYVSDYSKSKFAYIAGRLLEENLVIDSEPDPSKAIKIAFQTAWNTPKGKLYYRLMAADKLGITTEQILNELTKKNTSWEIKIDNTAQININLLLEEHDYKGAYNTYAANKFHVSTKQAFELGEKLAGTTSKNLNWYPEALRVFVGAISAADKPVTEEQYAKLYPRYYSTFVHGNAEKYAIPEYYMYALIRSESFFDANVVSYANAVGLTQLMNGTAADMALKLHISDYDTANPYDNILLGTHYIQELYGRLDNSYIQAFFSYNAGITRVRRWRKDNPDLPLDLFLEVVPISQTREYGRKIATAAAMYGAFYYNKSTSDVLNELFEK